MKKTTIRAVIIKSKVLKDGGHKVRISVAHNNETRYILTDIIIPSEKNFKKGEVVNLPTASILNRKIRKMIDGYYEVCEGISGIEYITCSQLIEILEHGGIEKRVLFKDIAAEWLEVKMKVKGTSTALYETRTQHFLNFVGEDFAITSLTPLVVSRYIRFLKKEYNNNETTVDIKIKQLKSIVYFATSKRRYVSFPIDPFVDYDAPPTHVRDVTLTIDELRTFRDHTFSKKGQIFAQNLFMLSFFMCGMNTCDIFKVDFSKEIARFRRSKTENRVSPDQWTTYTIPTEAKRYKELIGDFSETCVHNAKEKLIHNLPQMKEMVLPDTHRLIFYSARKTFAQIAAELGISDAVITYCIGDARSIKNSIDYYRRVTREMADNAIRLIFDFVASDKSVTDFKKERNLI